MAAARSCWKRLNTELEDGDECLPISKRICSLHIESQTQELSSQNNQGMHPYAGFPNGAVASAPVLGLDPWSAASQPSSSCRLDFNHELAPSAKAAGQLQQDNSAQDSMTARLAPGAHFGHLMVDPHTAGLEYQHKFDANCNQLQPGNLHYMSDPSYDKQSTHSQHGAQRLDIPHQDPSIHNSIHGSVAHHPGLPDFHVQQLPSGTYEPELGVDENPYYYCANQLLYEAHLYRVRRGNVFSSSS